MKYLLKETDLRRLEMVEFLSKQNTWTTSLELSQLAKSSQRVIKNDIAYLNESQLGFTILSSHQGLKIQFDTNNSISKLYQYVFNNSMAFKALELIFFNKDITPLDLQEELFISQSSYYRLISRINNSLIKNFNIQVDTCSCKIIGRERDIRYYFSTYFSERYCVYEWPFASIDEQALTVYLKFLLKHLNVHLGFADYASLKFCVAVNLTRYQAHHYVQLSATDTTIDQFWSSYPEMTEDLYQALRTLDIHLTEVTLVQLFGQFIHRNFTHNSKDLAKLLTTNQAMAQSVNFLSKLLDHLSDSYFIPFPNKEEVIWSINNTSYNEGFIPHTAYILHNFNNEIMIEFKKFHPKFINDLTLGIEAYRQLVDVPLTIFSIDHLVYQVCVQWQNLFTGFRNDWFRIDALFVSNFSTGRSQVILDIIENIYNSIINFEIYQGSELNAEIIASFNKDLVISTFPLPFVESTPLICYNSINAEDILTFHQTINEVVRNKNQLNYQNNEESK